MHVLPLRLHLQEFNGSLFQVLEQDDVVFADLVVHLSLEIIVRLEVAWAHPERLTLVLVGHQADQLNRLSSLSSCINRTQTCVGAESENGQKLDA